MINDRATLDFGAEERIDGSLSGSIRGLVGSEILKIAASVREMRAAGRDVCDLTVGDFDSRYFPIPDEMADGIRQAIAAGQTNYPPSDGLVELRQAIAEFSAREWGAAYPAESVLVASGARPILYGAYRAVVDPGDTVVYPVPSWNNNHYVWASGARGVALPTRPEDGFMPTPESLAPYIDEARLVCLNSPLNPTGTMITEDQMRALLELIVEENRRRERAGARLLFLLHDQVYASLVFGDTKHLMPAALVPESAPYVIALDGVSKAFAGTGLRVGWMLAPPPVTRRMKSLIGHIGAWAPKPEQAATAGFLNDVEAVARFRDSMDGRVRQRLTALYDGFEALRREGYPVECISPQGAIYLSLRLNLIGRRIDGATIETNEQIRRLLLDRAGMAVVPFQAFGLDEESGWFRLSIGAVSLDDIGRSIPLVRDLLDSAA